MEISFPIEARGESFGHFSTSIHCFFYGPWENLRDQLALPMSPEIQWAMDILRILPLLLTK